MCTTPSLSGWPEVIWCVLELVAYTWLAVTAAGLTVVIWYLARVIWFEPWRATRKRSAARDLDRGSAHIAP